MNMTMFSFFFVLKIKFIERMFCLSLLNFIYLFIYLWLCWVFVSVQGLSPVVASGGHSSSQCADLSLSRPLLLRSTGSRRAGSVIVAHGPSCSAACGIFRDQGSNPCALHWQADSQPLRHQGSPDHVFWSPNPFRWPEDGNQDSCRKSKIDSWVYLFLKWKRNRKGTNIVVEDFNLAKNSCRNVMRMGKSKLTFKKGNWFGFSSIYPN